MKESKLNELFALARKETPPAPEAGFEHLVMTALRRTSPPAAIGEISWLDQISAWTPRLTLGCAVLITICVVTDFALNLFGLPTLTDGMAQISGDWLITSNTI